MVSVSRPTKMSVLSQKDRQTSPSQGPRSRSRTFASRARQNFACIFITRSDKNNDVWATVYGTMLQIVIDINCNYMYSS